MNKFKQSAWCAGIIYLAIFAFMMMANFLTPLIADDYSYHFSFLTGERITGIFQIFPSLAGHAQKMNGRLVAHFWVQLFELLPKALFNVVNSLIFASQIFILHKIGTTAFDRKQNNNLVLVFSFCAIWFFQPAFGQVNLWLDGSCNYLWASTVGLVFLLPFINEFIKGQKVNNIAVKCLFVVLGFFVGAYSENTSAAFIFVAMLLWGATWLLDRKRPSLYTAFAILVSFVGYISIYLSPAELMNKGAEFSLAALRGSFINCLYMLKSFWILLAIYVVVLCLSCISNVNKRYIILSLALAGGAMAANFIMMFASYYASRSAGSVVIFLACATVVLLDKLDFEKYKSLIISGLAVLVLSASFHCMVGLNDIYNTFIQAKNNENHIYSCIEQGIMDITIDVIYADTKYSAAHGLSYVEVTETNVWPNTAMTKYYGVNSIRGNY